jgi:hypothetical protein
MVALLIILVAGDIISRNVSEGMNFIAGIIVVAAVGCTAYAWHLSMEADREIDRARQEFEQLLRP